MENKRNEKIVELTETNHWFIEGKEVPFEDRMVVLHFLQVLFGK